jgi:hypothetical protein
MRAEYGLVAALTLFSAIPSQGTAPRKLGAPTAKLDQEFTGIEGVWEMKDGRVVVLDAQDKAIHLLDMKTGTGTKIGRDGDGPGEFRLPLEIWRAGDSAVVRDMARYGKLMVITPKGEIGGFVSMLDSSLSTRIFNATSVDAAGRIYGEAPTTKGPMDSTRIVRWDMQKRTRDTVTRFMTSATPPSFAEADLLRDKSGNIVGYRPGPPRAFVPYNSWAVAPDGRVGLIWAAPYRVTYVKLDGSRVNGASVNYTPIPVTEAEKDAYKAEMTSPRPILMFDRAGGSTATFRKGTVMEGIIWSEVLPPFVSRTGTRFASDGMLWVQRHTKAGAPQLYDVFDASARVAFQLELPAQRKLIGFGNGTVYMARVDSDGLHYLERYALPASTPLRP